MKRAISPAAALIPETSCRYSARFLNILMRRAVPCRWRRKCAPFWRVEGASTAVTRWTSAARSQAEADSSSSRTLPVAVRQLWLPSGNRTTCSYRCGSRRLERDHQIMISEMRMRVKENLLEWCDSFFRSQFLGFFYLAYARPTLIGTGLVSVMVGTRNDGHSRSHHQRSKMILFLKSVLLSPWCTGCHRVLATQ